MSNVVGYARVSTREQNPDAQGAELRAAGAVRVFVDHGESSRIGDRPQWVACLDYLREGDTLVIRALDRVAGTEQMAIEIIRDLGRRGVRIKSLTEPFLDVDTSTPMGEAIVGIMAVLAQLRVATIRENTRRGLAHARAQGRVGGRPSVMTPERTAAAVQMRAAGHSIVQIATVLGVGKSSVSRALAKAGERELVSGAGGPYEVAQRYAAGEVDRDELVEELVRWQYVALQRTAGDGVDDVIVVEPGTFDEVAQALRDGLIDASTYEEIRQRRIRSRTAG
ncbi:recombinase family protein [Actinotalea sp. C106]|uniref:recombinase family protein n=1 Tax=Actinotalea sp. C106 TaxID=2908644 RepID=UPI0020277EC3|nr:recombinase family protein [Actinotalea sp. C106]